MRFLRTFSGSRPISNAKQLLNHTPYQHPDHQHLRSIFDSPPPSSKKSQSSTGIFDYHQLRTPQDLIHTAQKTVRRSGLIVTRICATFSPNQTTIAEKTYDARTGFLKCVGMFDRLSDGLCRMIDLAELLRNLHPDPVWINAADQTHDLLCRYMNTLNTHRELYLSLENSLENLSNHALKADESDLFASKTVALQFLRDFKRHGIHLPTDSRRRLVDLSDRMLLLGRAFFSGSTSTSNPDLSSTDSLVQVHQKEASSLGPNFYKRLEFDSEGHAYLNPFEWEAFQFLRSHSSESVRKRIWIAQNQSTDDQIDLLETLLRTRHEFARLTGKSNWAEVALEDKMAVKPENVLTFLSQLSNKTKPTAINELRSLQILKQQQLNRSSLADRAPLPTIFPWDRDYYVNLLNRQQTHANISSNTLSQYFSVGTCIQGLSRLFDRIYGISFIVESHQPEEVWHESVIKIGVMDENEGRIGTIYCDLFDREGKPTGAAHYTVLCSRRTDLDDQETDFDYLGSDEVLVDEIRLSRDGCEFLHVPVSARHGRPGTYQRPVVVFSCSFDPPDRSARQPSLLNWSDVETLFHEMGHAMHSMIGQTEYHNVAGTRCPTDLVELPSILMEHFTTSPAVISLFARHYHTDQPLSPSLHQAYLRSQHQFRALETNSQIVMATVDQFYHSDLAGDHDFDSSRVWQQVQSRYGVIPFIEGTSSQTKFGHLHGYGAGYYSYLFDRSIASRVWEKLFEKDPLNREMGERYKTELLEWGGGRDCWVGVGSLLGDSRIKEGGMEAIGLIGSWGLWND